METGLFVHATELGCPVTDIGRPVVAEAARRIVAETRHEPGVVGYSFFQDPADPRSSTIVEVWSDADVFANHGSSEHLAKFRAGVSGAGDPRRQGIDGESRTRR